MGTLDMRTKCENSKT